MLRNQSFFWSWELGVGSLFAGTLVARNLRVREFMFYLMQWVVWWVLWWCGGVDGGWYGVMRYFE